MSDDPNDRQSGRAWQTRDGQPAPHSTVELNPVTNGHDRPREPADSPESAPVDISVIAPVFNEAGNLYPLHDRIVATLWGLNRSFEVIYVDDGSSDASFAELTRIAAA